VASRLVELEDGRLEVVERAFGVSRRWRVIELEEPPGRPPSPEEMAAGFVPGPVQPRTIDYYSEAMDDGRDRRRAKPGVTAVRP
jgi:hypothetical protein